jgi:geranylgeranylglycerol-phosphate geranylgeranyltransferase
MMSRRLDPLAFLIISRPANVAITAASVWVAGVISNVRWTEFSGRMALAAVSAALIAAGGNAYNDYCDRDLDRLQKPGRPVPSGRIIPQAALWWSTGCFLAGIVVASRLGIITLSIAAWAGLLLMLYSRTLKRLPLVGNLAVALVSALAFIYGGVAVYQVEAAFWAALLAFFFHLGREIIKDMEDETGDRAAGAATLPIRYGTTSARLSAMAAFLFLVIMLPLPYFMGNFRTEYLVVVLCGVVPVLLTVGILSWRWSKPEQLHRLSLILKLDMLVGLYALYLGRPL